MCKFQTTGVDLRVDIHWSSLSNKPKSLKNMVFAYLYCGISSKTKVVPLSNWDCRPWPMAFSPSSALRSPRRRRCQTGPCADPAKRRTRMCWTCWFRRQSAKPHIAESTLLWIWERVDWMPTRNGRLGFLRIFGTHSVRYTQICKWIFISDLNFTEEIGVQRPHQMKSHMEIMFIKAVSSMIYTCRYTICCTHNYLNVHAKPWNYSCVDLKKNSNAREFTRIHQNWETVSKCKYVCSRCMHFLYFAPFYRFPISHLGIISYITIYQYIIVLHLMISPSQLVGMSRLRGLNLCICEQTAMMT